MRFRLFLALACALAIPGVAGAQTFGQFTGAQTLPVNGHLFGGYLQSSESVLGLLGQLRLSFYPGIDFGFNGGFARQDYESDSRTTLRLGTDIKCQAITPSADRPFALGVGGALGVESGDGYSLLSLGPTVVGSRTFPGSGEVTFTPYIGTGVMFSKFEAGPTSDNDMSFPLNLGTEVRFNSQITLTGELQLRLSDSFNDDVGFALGVNSPF